MSRLFVTYLEDEHLLNCCVLKEGPHFRHDVFDALRLGHCVFGGHEDGDWDGTAASGSHYEEDDAHFYALAPGPTVLVPVQTHPLQNSTDTHTCEEKKPSNDFVTNSYIKAIESFSTSTIGFI